MLRAWHFMRAGLRLGYGDGRIVRPGEWLEHDGQLALCQSGLHASGKILDALQYAPGPIICRVELDGSVIVSYDKAVAQRRRVAWWVDGTRLLREFACRCALDVRHLWGMPNVVYRYLTTRDEKLRDAAWAAATAAARAAASAARAAVWDTAAAAASDAAWAAAWAAVWAGAADTRDTAAAAARAAVWDTAAAAASDDVRARQERQLKHLIYRERRAA